MIELQHLDNGNIELTILDRKNFKQRSTDDDQEELLTDLLEENGYYSYKVEEGLKSVAAISCDGTTYVFKQDVRPVVNELNKYGFAIFKKV